MENAIWKNNNLIALEVANEFELEREVRKASSRKELLCPDKGCKCPIVRYCHGEVKGAYFAHLTNEKCDYADFDKNDTPIFRLLRLKLYKHFSELGYKVKCEEKILEHHYSQLAFELSSGSKIALEFGTKQTSANLIDSLAEEYRRKNIAVKWLVVSDSNYGRKENELYYIKRYLLNISKLKEYIIITSDGKNILQSRWDCNQYEYSGCHVHLTGFDDTYSEAADLSLLTIDDGELTIRGFDDRYWKWLQRKRQAFEEEINRRKEREKRLSESKALGRDAITYAPFISPPYKHKQEGSKTLSKSYEGRRAEIIDQMDQQEEVVRDSTDVRWVKCELCGKIGEDAEFSNYGGPNHVNLGVCNDCIRKKHSK